MLFTAQHYMLKFYNIYIIIPYYIGQTDIDKSIKLRRGLPWSTGINRDVPGRDSEILNMFKITGLCGVHPGGRLYRALPCRHRVGAGICRVYAGVYRIDAGTYRISISAPMPFLCRGVPCWLPYRNLKHSNLTLWLIIR